MGKFIDLTGKTFGRLTVIERAENDKRGGARWLCQCECGDKTIASSGHLKTGHTQSCGCFCKEQTIKSSTTHGQRHTRLYGVWRAIHDRCENKNDSRYKSYGGRGIKCCDEWVKFELFYDWALTSGYQRGLSIDRIDNDGNYEEKNCRWITMLEQARNKQNNVKYNGETMAECSRRTGLKIATISRRINILGWTIEKAFITQARGYKCK